MEGGGGGSLSLLPALSIFINTSNSHSVKNTSKDKWRSCLVTLQAPWLVALDWSTSCCEFMTLSEAAGLSDFVHHVCY